MPATACQNCKQEFAIDDPDLAFYKKMQVPPPTFCPQCRFQRRCAYINVRNLYARPVPGAGASAISMYSPDKKLNIVDDRAWWSDAFDMLSYGRDYDFSKPFFTQYRELLGQAPLPHLQREYPTMQNSDYCNAAAALKNCYLVINADYNEDCMYCNNMEKSKFCADLSFSHANELCHQGIRLKNCYDCRECEECESSSGLRFCRDCIGCTDCIGCSGLRHKSNHIFNKPYSPAEYAAELKKLDLGSFAASEKMKEKAADFFRTKPRKFMQGRNNQNVQGDCISESKNVRDSHLVDRAEECRFVHFIDYVDSVTVSAYDYTMFGVGSELMYEDAWCGLRCHNVKFSMWNYGLSDSEFCIGCHYSKHLFGCIGLRQKQFCVFNRHYSEAEYHELVRKIKEQMMQLPYRDTKGNEYRYGEFFPADLSPFAYNQTIAQDYCPLTEDACKAEGYGWHVHDRGALPAHTRWDQLPDHIRDVGDDIFGKPILCKAHDDDPDAARNHNCSRVFKIIPQELALYRKLGIPLPRNCHSSRYHARLQKLNPFRTWTRQCMCKEPGHDHQGACGEMMETSFGPERSETVYCEKCYLKTVY